MQNVIQSNYGIILVPDFMLFGYWGFTPFPFLMLVIKSQRNNKALIAHEQCHQEQQRRDGWFKFWFNYIFDKNKRLNYEIEAYKVWLKVQPEDHAKVVYWLQHNYNTGLTQDKIIELLALEK